MEFTKGQTVYRVSYQRIVSATILEVKERTGMYGAFTEVRLAEGVVYHNPEDWFSNETAARRELITVLEVDIKAHKAQTDRLEQLLRDALRLPH